MHTDSGMTGISLSGYMPYMTVASLEMSDEPILCILSNKVRHYYSINEQKPLFTSESEPDSNYFFNFGAT